jgi:hypothetical protein
MGTNLALKLQWPRREFSQVWGCLLGAGNERNCGLVTEMGEKSGFT